MLGSDRVKGHLLNLLLIILKNCKHRSRNNKLFHSKNIFIGMFGAGMISSYLKLVHIFSINPYLGPLQVSLGKMIIDIFKWMVMYILVLFAFGCGLNQLLWYYADLEKKQCYSLPGGLMDPEANTLCLNNFFSN